MIFVHGYRCSVRRTSLYTFPGAVGRDVRALMPACVSRCIVRYKEVIPLAFFNGGSFRGHEGAALLCDASSGFVMLDFLHVLGSGATWHLLCGASFFWIAARLRCTLSSGVAGLRFRNASSFWVSTPFLFLRASCARCLCLRQGSRSCCFVTPKVFGFLHCSCF